MSRWRSFTLGAVPVPRRGRRRGSVMISRQLLTHVACDVPPTVHVVPRALSACRQKYVEHFTKVDVPKDFGVDASSHHQILCFQHDRTERRYDGKVLACARCTWSSVHLHALLLSASVIRLSWSPVHVRHRRAVHPPERRNVHYNGHLNMMDSTKN